MDSVKNTKNDPIIDALFRAGVHYGYARSRRHPSVKPYIFTSKNKTDIFDLEKTKDLLEKSKELVRNLGREGKQVLFVGSKHEALPFIKKAAEELAMPFVAGRWVGGTLTNFSVIRARIDKLLTLREQRDAGELASKYTKKERLMIDREIARLENLFSGLVLLKNLPSAIVVIDPGKEHIVISEARKMGVTVIALAGSDCDLALVNHPVVGNDASSQSIALFLEAITLSYREGQKRSV